MTYPVINEATGQLHKADSVVLNAQGYGVIIFTTENARQRWEVTTVVVSTDQDPTVQPYPRAEVFVNDVSSAGNSQGATWTGNQDTFTGTTDVGPCDNLMVLFEGGPPGAVATARLGGTKYTRRT
jgi:hypothetical protein